MKIRPILRTKALAFVTATAAIFIVQPLRAQTSFSNSNARPTVSSPAKPTDSEGFFLMDDYQRSIDLSIEKVVGSPQTLSFEPIFANAPFLHLKAGESLFKGRRWESRFKGSRAGFAGSDSYFLQSNNAFNQLEFLEVKPNPASDNLILLAPQLSLLFDWEFTQDNVATLAKIYGNRAGTPLTLQNYRDLRMALRKNFAESLGQDVPVVVPEPYLEGANEKRHGIFHGLAYDRSHNTIYLYRLKIGGQIFQQWRKNLIVGPPRVEREEFEGRKDGGRNSGGTHTPDPQTAQQKRADYERMLEFQRVVDSFLPARPNIGLFR